MLAGPRAAARPQLDAAMHRVLQAQLDGLDTMRVAGRVLGDAPTGMSTSSSPSHQRWCESAYINTYNVYEYD